MYIHIYIYTHNACIYIYIYIYTYIIHVYRYIYIYIYHGQDLDKAAPLRPEEVVGRVGAAHPLHALRMYIYICIYIYILFTLLDVCASSLRRGHANLLCIVPILTDDPRREPVCIYIYIYRERERCLKLCYHYFHVYSF